MSENITNNFESDQKVSTYVLNAFDFYNKKE